MNSRNDTPANLIGRLPSLLLTAATLLLANAANAAAPGITATG